MKRAEMWKCFLYKEEWKEKYNGTKKIMVNKRLDMKDKTEYNLIINYNKRREIYAGVYLGQNANGKI
jgi:hypothetical protein